MRISGLVEKTARADAEAYFEMHPRDAQLSALASWQSSQIADHEFLDARVAKLERKYEDQEIPAPSAWGGYRLRPETLEFWQSRANHLHDRLRYVRHPDGRWVIDRLAP